MSNFWTTYQYGLDPADLTAPERKMFARLAGRDAGDVVTKTELAKLLGNASTLVVDSAACRLGAKLRESCGERVLENVWGVGYRLRLPSGVIA